MRAGSRPSEAREPTEPRLVRRSAQREGGSGEAHRAKRGLLYLAAASITAAAFVAQPEPVYKDNLPLAHPGIRYQAGPTTDVVSRLVEQIARGRVTLDRRPGDLGYLPALLDRLQIPTDSQMLVFSKTSFQAEKISPDHPRAIYFNDTVAVGYVPGAVGIEVAAVDPVRGPIFYAMAPDQAGTPAFTRSEACLRCHHGPNTAGVPGIYVGSVIPGPTGAPLRDDSAIITDHRSAFRDRWGGWYVTAKKGEQPDRANAVASNPSEPETLVRESRQNLPHLLGLFNPSGYLAPTSDIVALMTFEHQTQMTNLITRVGWQARMLAHGGTPNAVAERALAVDVEELVHYMLFGDEAPLKEPIEGVSSFTKTFAERGPRDARGRSLRDFDLRTRLFRYPLSYLIYSEAFDALPDAVRARVYRRFYDVLSGVERGAPFAHLSRDDRRAILEILRATKRGLPKYFGTP